MRWVSVLLALLLTAAVAPAAAGDGIALDERRDDWYAENDTFHWGDGTRVRVDEACVDLATEDERVACSLEAFQERPFVVIAFVDTGINPYHHDFRAEEFTHHPSAFIDGYPSDATRLDVSLDVADTDGYDAARAADASTYQGLQRQALHWIPGTRIIGAYTAATSGTPILDTNGHGTGVASVGAGRYYGSNPEALIVVVDALAGQGLRWATDQEWIDIVSNSYGNLGHLPLGEVHATREAVERGQSVVFSAGNTPQPGLTSPYGTGPSWTLKVGAASPVNGQSYNWTTTPPDVSSFGLRWAAASATGVTVEDKRDFGGTSCAAPTTAGVLSSVIQAAREQFGDTAGGQRPGAVVAAAGEGSQVPADGPLADGRLTLAEAEEIVKKTAFPVEFDPDRLADDVEVTPTTPAYYVHKGYGLVDRDAKARAHEVLFGDAPLPDRSDVDTWMQTVDTARDAFWNNYP